MNRAFTALLMFIVSFYDVRIASASEIYPFYRDIRAQAMGGAGLAIVDDPSSLFINPAGLGKIRGSYLSLINAEIETNLDTQSAISTNNNYSAITNSQTLLNVAKANPNVHIHALAQVLPAFVTTNFGIGVLGKYSVDAEYNPATNMMHLDYFNDYALTMGYCLRIFSGIIKIAASGKLVNRVYVNKDIPGTTTNLTLDTVASEGTGVGWDGALMLTAPVTYLPTITAVMHDVGNTNFNLGNGYFYKTGLTPPPQMQSTDVGIGIFPILGRGARMSISAEYRDIQNPEAQDPLRRVHAGIEINLNDTFYLRGGMNQRYYTAGLEWSFAHSQLQLTTYGEEIGTATAYREDRRYALEYAFRF